MIRRISSLAWIIGTVAVSASARATPPPMRRVAVVVGANDPPPGRPALRYARDDATELAAVLEQVGGFAPPDVLVLLDPHPGDLLKTLDDARTAMSRTQGDTLFVFYYSGHSDGQALFPHGEPVALADLRTRIEGLGARIRVGILDTCRGGSWTQSKGLSVGPPLSTADLLNLDTEGTALVSSSSGVEDAHEADTVRGSFFTHYLAAGLRGAADRERDGNVTLQEAFDYARDRTVRDTARLASAPQHPSFDLTLRGRQDIVLAVLPASTSALQLSATKAPIEIIHLPSGVTVVDAPVGRQPLRVALAPGRYLVRSLVDGRVYAKEVEIHPGETATLAEDELEATGNQRLAVKSADEPQSPTDQGLDLRPKAVVHIEGDEGVVLERSERNGPWTVACTAPCDQALPLSSAYRLSGPSVRSSTTFQLAARAGDHVVVHANAASRAAFVGGIVLTAAGAVSMLGGALIANTEASQQAAGQASSGPSRPVLVGMFAGGAAAILGGVLLMVENLHSKVEQWPSPLPPRSDAWLRSPTWHEDRTGASLSTGATSGPLLHIGF
jgi:hypothetical protein